MSAPNTNLETQKRRHFGPLSGMALAGVFAGVLLLGFLAWLSANGNTPEDTGPQVEYGVGAETDGAADDAS